MAEYQRRWGVMAGWRLFAAAFAVALICLTAPTRAQDRLKGVALVIGNGEYESLAKLPNPENDARGVEELLDGLGFETNVSSDRDARRLKRDLEGFVEDAESADVAVLYYSGHGIEAAGENYLVPVDADVSALDDAAEKLVPMSAIIAELKARVPVVIIMLDACRDNPFPPGATLKARPDAAPAPVAAGGLGESRSAASLDAPAAATTTIDQTLGTVLAFAAEPGKVALDGDPGQNSPYAAALIRHLTAMSGEEFGTVMRMVAEEVYLKTAGRQRPWMNESMRRLLYFGQAGEQPSGAEGDILAERRSLLITIAALPDIERRTIESVAAQDGVPMDALYGMLRVLGADVPKDPAELENLLRGQTSKVKEMMAERNAITSSDPEIMRLSELADRALAEGALNTAIALRQQAKARATEVDKAVDQAEENLKARRLELAAVYAKSAEAYALAFEHRKAGEDYEQAFAQIEKWDEDQAFWYLRSASSAYLDAGKYRGGPEDLRKAVDTGRRAAELAERKLKDSAQEKQQANQDIWAQSLNNLANATKALHDATGDPAMLRETIATFEQALNILQRERVPTDWATVQNNLAGALQTLGESSNDIPMLERAVKAYRAAMEEWTRETIPERWSVVIANLGSAQEEIGWRTNDAAMLRQAIASMEGALEVQTRDNAPLDWAWTQAALASVYSSLGNLERDKTLLDKAVEHYDLAMQVQTLERMPRHWAKSKHNVAVIYQQQSDFDKGTDGHDKAAAIYREILAGISRQAAPGEWALSQGNLGVALLTIGKARKDEAMLETAQAASRTAREVYVEQSRPVDIARIDIDLGDASTELGKIRRNEADFVQAAQAYATSMQAYEQAGDAGQQRRARRGLAYAEVEIGYIRSQAGDYPAALANYESALSHRSREDEPLDWAFARAQIAIVLYNMGEREEGVETLRKSAAAYREALAIQLPGKIVAAPENQQSLAGVLRMIGERASEPKTLVEAADALKVLIDLPDISRLASNRETLRAERASLLSVAGQVNSDATLLQRAADEYAGVFSASGPAPDNEVFHRLNDARTLHALAALKDEAAAYKAALVALDAALPLAERNGGKAQLAYALMDRATLLQAIAAKAPASVSAADIEAAFRRAAAIPDRTADAVAWLAAQRALVGYLLAGSDSPDKPMQHINDGIDRLKSVFEATPRQQEPAAWAELANWYGYELALRGERSAVAADFEVAVPILRDAVATYRELADDRNVAHSEDSLCTALTGLGAAQASQTLLVEAVGACERAVAIMREQKMDNVLKLGEAHLAASQNALTALGDAPEPQ